MPKMVDDLVGIHRLGTEIVAGRSRQTKTLRSHSLAGGLKSHSWSTDSHAEEAAKRPT